MNNMKIYFWKPGKRLKKDVKTNWNYKHKCKRCKEKNILNFSDFKSVDALYDDGVKTEEKIERIPSLIKLGFRNVKMERDMFEKIKIFKAICPNCAKEKKIFFQGTSPKTYEYGEWRKYYNSEC